MIDDDDDDDDLVPYMRYLVYVGQRCLRGTSSRVDVRAMRDTLLHAGSRAITRARGGRGRSSESMTGIQSDTSLYVARRAVPGASVDRMRRAGTEKSSRCVSSWTRPHVDEKTRGRKFKAFPAANSRANLGTKRGRYYRPWRKREIDGYWKISRRWTWQSSRDCEKLRRFSCHNIN